MSYSLVVVQEGSARVTSKYPHAVATPAGKGTLTSLPWKRIVGSGCCRWRSRRNCKRARQRLAPEDSPARTMRVAGIGGVEQWRRER